jgi:L-aminopeptidase/D-esterase-like protein
MAALDTLTDRIDALAEALRAAGVSDDRIATILGSAAAATMQALVLDAVLEANAAPAPTPKPKPEQELEPVEAPLRVAA